MPVHLCSAVQKQMRREGRCFWTFTCAGEHFGVLERLRTTCVEAAGFSIYGLKLRGAGQMSAREDLVSRLARRPRAAATAALYCRPPAPPDLCPGGRKGRELGAFGAALLSQTSHQSSALCTRPKHRAISWMKRPRVPARLSTLQTEQNARAHDVRCPCGGSDSLLIITQNTKWT